MTSASVYETCSANATEDFEQILKCVSDATEEMITTETESIAAGINSFYLIFAGALVYFMQTGFAMLCAGSIRAKNVKNVILWNLLDSCGGGLAFWATGYAFAYGGDGDDDPQKTFVGNKGFFLQGDDNILFESWFFQFAFACALSSIVAGTIAERTQMKAYLLYSVFLVGFVYPVVAHAWWSTKGFLSPFADPPMWGSGAIDLAGSGPVHMTGGVTALIAAIILGPRIGRFHDADGNLLDEPAEFPAHSVALQFLGTFCLWFGWYGFNPGSVLTIASTTQGQAAALVAVNTTLAACSGAISAMFTSTLFDWWYTGVHTYDLAYTMNGCLSGLVAITAPCATVDTWAAVVIGIFAGWFYLIGSKVLIWLRIDDAVDAIPVHMVGGAWGVFAAGLFSKPEFMLRTFGQDDHVGWFYNGSDFTLAGAQLCGIMFNFGWVFVVMGCYFYFLNYMGWFRIDPLEEEVGMDISRHKGAAWVIDNAKEEHITQLSKHRSQLLDDGSNSRRGSKKDLNAATATDDATPPPKKEEVSSSGDDAPVPNPEIVDGDGSAHC